MAHPELASEQAYVDNAYAALERTRKTIERAAGAAATDVAAEAIERWSIARLHALEEAERGLCFGRIDVESADTPVYVGRRWVDDEDAETLVVNWQAPTARPFYTATPDEPHGVTLRRRFRTEGRRLLDLSDETLDGSLEDALTSVDDFLLEELDRAREGRMRDIVATIQADQYRLIAREPIPPLVVQGGPGTGKTAVGLHRASYLLFAHRAQLRRVLVVGPNRTFMDYVSHVLPSLGEESVEQRAIGELVDGSVVSRVDTPAAAALKGDGRLAEVVRRAAELRLQPGSGELVVRMEGSFVGVEEDEVAELLSATRAELGLSLAARERFRMDVLRRFYEDYCTRLGALAVRPFEDVERVLRKNGRLKRFLDQVWPTAKPDQLVSRLLSTRSVLQEAADGLLDASELAILLRRGRGWSDGDVALLDEAHALIGAPPLRFGHVIVDEAQDLTPMQLRMIGRRAAHGFTVLGDVAQATGAVAYGEWDEILAHLPGGTTADVVELRHAYRVPREIMELALPLLDLIAPGTEPPVSYRTGADPPRVVQGEPVLAHALQEAAALAEEEGLLAVIAPASLTTAGGTPSLFDAASIPVLTPRQAKGLEFDHVVVVEPALIVDEGTGEQGLRELYVALTRPTKTLVVVHSRPLPDALTAPRAARPASVDGASARA
ncbi:MAG TPA: UvrD-helicase domain-containing protein [Gaiellaceae bacterium]|nr:UvrD-helicase domain-containing protein [Gaiellaceae bacterium]